VANRSRKTSVNLVERTGFELVQLSAWPSTSPYVFQILTEDIEVQPPETPNTVTRCAHTNLFWIAPHRWLIMRPVARDNGLATELAARFPSDTATMVELSAARSVLVVSGSRSRDVLAKLLPLDLSISKFPPGCCAQSVMAQIGVLLHAAGEDTLEIFAYRSFARHLREVLADAALEFGFDARSG
jgi:methylglutamate dehydrogenase subunit D